MGGLDDLDVYQRAIELGEHTHAFIREWDGFDRDTIGKQMIRAVDSVAANISEGYAHQSTRQRTWFMRIARASLSEYRTWLDKSHRRLLIHGEDHRRLVSYCSKLRWKLNGYIKYLERSQT